MRDEIARGAAIKPPRFLAFVVKYVSLPYLLIIAIFWMTRNLKTRIMSTMEDSVAQLSILFFIAMFVFLFILSTITMKRWREEETRAPDSRSDVEAQ